MKRISLWGYQHKWAARFLIVLCYIVLNTIGFILGDLLLYSGVEVSAFLVYLFTAVYLTGFVLYPLRKNKPAYKNFYRRQKTCDALLVTASFLLIISAANLRHTANTPFQPISVGAVVPVTQLPGKTIGIQKPNKKHSLIHTVKKKAARLFQKVRNFYNSRSTAEKAVLIFLAVVLALVALYGVLALSCSLSCAGSDAAALVVGILGATLIVFLFARALRGIKRMNGKEKAQPPKDSEG